VRAKDDAPNDFEKFEFVNLNAKAGVGVGKWITLALQV
jgi:hypothetical protein